ncbi:WXG100 family type VII secretion target [Actinoplanes sp. DH11]|uniref:WXG100 family type VII secretion target n=1 Tax=Actinoplanes sp. DH11 TaxID=2857011 RepID=UPI001E3ABE63|nr:hypothetical protein [Actinoplanes sp. DH11]
MPPTAVAGIVSGIRDNSWVDPALTGAGTTLDMLSLAIDPLGGLVAWGVSWLLEHVRPLKDALDQLTGNADEVAAHAATWSGIAATTERTGHDYAIRLGTDVSGWHGASGDAYRRHADQHLEMLAGVAEAARGVSYAVEGAGLLVASVREIVRDLLAEFVGTLAARLPQWLAVEGLTLGVASPLVISQVTALVLNWAHRIQGFVRALLNSLRRLGARLSGLFDTFRRLERSAQRLARTQPAGTPSHGRSRQTGGEVRPPRNNMDYEVRWADEAYDAIRAADEELPAIARTAAGHGFTADDVVRIKSHLFREEHLLDSYSDGEMGRFDANPRIAEAWHRLAAGEPHPADIDLLKHERFEAEYMARTGDPSYRRAHAATLNAGFTWDPEAAATDGLGYRYKP